MILPHTEDAEDAVFFQRGRAGCCRCSRERRDDLVFLDMMNRMDMIYLTQRAQRTRRFF